MIVRVCENALKMPLKSLNHSSHSVSAMKSGKKVFRMPVDVAEVFNKHFSTIGQEIANAFKKGKKATSEHLRKRTNKSFHLHHVTRNFVKSQRKVIQRLC